MSYIFNLDDIRLSSENESEFVVCFSTDYYEAILSFVVSVPKLNRAISVALNTSPSSRIWCVLLINGCRFRIYRSDLVSLKNRFEILSK